MDAATARQLLKRLEITDMRLPAGLRIVVPYEQLVEAGLAVEMASGSDVIRQFSITAEGHGFLHLYDN
jgi:hypothetical protein